MFSVVLVFSIIGLGRILISDLVVANLLMYLLSGMIVLYLAMPFFTSKEISSLLQGLVFYCDTNQTQNQLIMNSQTKLEAQILIWNIMISASDCSYSYGKN